MLSWFRRRKAPEAIEGRWVLGTAARLQENRAGQLVEYPGRVLVCPRGHERVIPTRFDHAPAELTCRACGRAYPLGTLGSS